MYSVYFIVSEKTSFYYVGMTKNSLKKRFISHKSSARRGVKTPLYSCMRKHGIDNFLIVLRDEFESKEECCEAEKMWIRKAKLNNHKILNLAEGGEGGFVITDTESWKIKLREKRKGRKPALGMSHTEENKKYFSKCSREYWATQETYNPEEVCSLSFKDANKIHGISKTHYYRLKRSLTNDQ